ncbi:regulatory protein, luxR family [Actinacidiphila yanglinensis]|uniref:Regulatory protein, luxR family n=1 Tax=Actinacidiphila yanglinensis TaxID=310779 RepID=A0A1H5YTU7_9ACTN|nr:LuxR C-terminal-related transcriptional regulator [Actinacidiphila yanglinensis]SEG27541.1 regulatory protein, luxR family [Actinacidiphila yanglinensis]
MHSDSGDDPKSGPGTGHHTEPVGDLREVLHAATHVGYRLAINSNRPGGWRSTEAHPRTGTDPDAGAGTSTGSHRSSGQQTAAVDQFSGPYAGALILRELAAGLSESVDTLYQVPPPLDRTGAQWRLEADAAPARRGVRVRALYPRAVLGDPAGARFLQELSEAGVIVRVVDHTAHDMLIFDRHTVCLPAEYPSAAPAGPGSPVPLRPARPVGPAGTPGAPGPSLLRVRGSALVRSFTAIYESYWQRATPLPLAGARLRQAALGELERAVIRLMTNGYGDDRIARRLGIERRTVEDVMAALMERLGAGSRFEVGYKLARALDPSELSPGAG